MKLIDADKLLEALGVFTDEEHGDPHFLNGIETAREIVEGMSEAVVRCGECKYLAPGGICEMFADDMIEPSASDYCSYGKRRNDEID